MSLHQGGVVVRAAEHSLPAAAAAAQAGPVHRAAGELVVRAPQQGGQVFGGGLCVPPLELHGLTGARPGAHGEGARVRIRGQQVANQEVPPVEVLEVFVDRQSDEEVAVRLPFLVR